MSIGTPKNREAIKHLSIPLKAASTLKFILLGEDF
jgi:hypothetical protein